jgi:hypothetical protein
LLDRVEEAVNNIMNTQLARACEVVTGQQEAIARLVAMLLEQDTVEAEGIEECFATTPRELVQPSVAASAGDSDARTSDALVCREWKDAGLCLGHGPAGTKWYNPRQSNRPRKLHR